LPVHISVGTTAARSEFRGRDQYTCNCSNFILLRLRIHIYPRAPTPTIYIITIREPKSMDSVLTRLTDDLLTGQKTGYAATDFSRPADDPERSFRVKLMLLLWVGDYPGQAKICNMKHAGAFGCHWCHQRFSTIGLPGYSLALNQRRLLPMSHPARSDASFGPSEMEQAPKVRTHSAVVKDGLDAHNWQGVCYSFVFVIITERMYMFIHFVCSHLFLVNVRV
jgi:hypothetical protein